jgi:pyrroline-5-carboxylate reductase
MKFGIIGCGSMAAAILCNALESGFLLKGNVVASDRDAAKTKEFAARFGVKAAATNAEVVAQSDVVLFAVKPQDAEPVFTALASGFNGQKTAVSIIAGLSIARMEAWLGKDTPIVRVMPNTPIQVGEGASVYTANAACPEDRATQIAGLFQAGGISLPAPESLFDAVTALSGSGPAYVFLFLEALAQAAHTLGLPTSLATPLLLQTIKGSVALLEASKESPQSLRHKVTSKGGTTEAALHVLSQGHFVDIVEKALRAAKDRSAELTRSECKLSRGDKGS